MIYHRGTLSGHLVVKFVLIPRTGYTEKRTVLNFKLLTFSERALNFDAYLFVDSIHTTILQYIDNFPCTHCRALVRVGISR